MGHGHLTPEDLKKYQTFEGLDYDYVDNTAHRSFQWRSSTRARTLKRVNRWFATFCIGLVAGLTAWISHVVIHGIHQGKFELVEEYLEMSDGTSKAFFTFMFINLAVATCGSLIVVFWEPAAAGSGIPEVKAYLNGALVRKTFNIRTYIAKLTSVICAVSSSFPCGPEGPMIHIGGIIGASVSQGRSKTMGFDSNVFKQFRNPRDRRDFISSGAAAGVSAAFSAPIGGLLFALEEASSFWNNELTWRTFFGCMVATFTTNFLLSGANGEFTPDATIVYRISVDGTETLSYRIWELIPFLLMGLVGGLLGALFTWFNLQLNELRKIFINPRPRLRILEVMILSVIFSVLIFFLPMAFECKVLDEAGLTEEDVGTRYNCHEGQFNAMATLSFVPQEEAVNALFSRASNVEFSTAALLVFSFLYYFFGCWMAGTALSSGIVVPMLIIGGSYGRAFGIWMKSLFGPQYIPGVYALVGASSFVGGVTRMSMSFSIILLEITNQLEYLLPIMLTMMTGKLVGDYFTHPLYDALIGVKCIPFLEPDPSPEMEKLTCRDVMNTPIVTLKEEDTVANLLQTVDSCEHNAFPVVNLHGRLVGILRRKDLLLLVDKKAYKEEVMFPPNEFQVLRMDAAVNLKTIRQACAPEDLGCMFNLRPYLHRSPFVVREHFSVSTAFVVFRSLGLRHLVVVDFFNRPQGMITRMDLLETVVAQVLEEGGDSVKHSYDSFYGPSDGTQSYLQRAGLSSRQVGSFSQGSMSLTLMLPSSGESQPLSAEPPRLPSQSRNLEVEEDEEQEVQEEEEEEEEEEDTDEEDGSPRARRANDLFPVD